MLINKVSDLLDKLSWISIDSYIVMSNGETLQYMSESVDTQYLSRYVKSIMVYESEEPVYGIVAVIEIE